VAAVGNVNEILDGRVVLDLECLDRIYLKAYVPRLRVGGQVVTFFSQHRNHPIASPALIQRMGEAFRQEWPVSPNGTRFLCCGSPGVTVRSM
jgi:hypothetical protein